MATVKTALIVGGGIGGLAAAVALQRLGVAVTIIERANAPREVGAGLWLWQNALVALDYLGIGDAVRAAGVQDAHGGVRDGQGKVLVERVPSQHHHISVAILRADLQAALSRALEPQTVQYGVTCTDFAQDSDGVTLGLSDGRSLRGDLLIGADGIHSTVRARLFGVTAPRYAGFTAWRAVTPFPHDRIPSGVSWGHGSRFGFMPIAQGRVNWFAGCRLAAGTPESALGRKHEVLEHFRTWYTPIPEIIEATDEADILRNDIYWGAPLRAWSRGRVTLLGDAAHPMTPSIGQGACQAIEDAAVLALCLREESDPVAALQHYDQRRVRRANAVARYSGFMDWLALWQDPRLCTLRNVIVTHVPTQWRDRQLGWILNYRVH